jgi:hypothetical protein
VVSRPDIRALFARFPRAAKITGYFKFVNVVKVLLVNAIRLLGRQSKAMALSG